MASPADKSDSSILPLNLGETDLFLDGGVLGCPCPDCGAPMAIRLWLMLADCAVCGASVELTEEQQRRAEQLLREAQKRAPAPPVAKKPEPPRQAPPPPKPTTQRAAPAKTAPKPRTAPVEAPRATPMRRAATYWREKLIDLPSWLISLILHLVAMLMLSMLFLDLNRDDGPRELLLSTQVGPANVPESGVELEDAPDPQPIDDAGMDEPVERDDPFAAAESESQQPGDMLDELLRTPIDLGDGPPRGGVMYQGRNPSTRPKLALEEGGTIASEAAVARGLIWLSQHQHHDGHWSLDRFHEAGSCNGRCGGGASRADNAATALALLPFLGAGQTHYEGQYTLEVQKGLTWLVRNQQVDGGYNEEGIGRMYAHCLATIALCEAYGMTQDRELARPAQMALEFLINAQSNEGGWRYYPGESGDTSVVGWAMMALRSGQMAGLSVPDEPFQKATRYLDMAACDSMGATYGYMPGFDPSLVMTAEGLLCRQFGGWTHENAGLRVGVGLLNQNPPDLRARNMYYWYYATQVLHHYGGDEWNYWNAQMRDLLVSLQEVEGHEAGSWTPYGGHDDSGGRLYMTSLAVCTLEVYYRHLPLYRAKALEP